MGDSRLPRWLTEDLASWARADLPPFPYRATHPHVSRAKHVLVWICDRHELQAWHSIKPSWIQKFCADHPELKASTLASYLKSLRRWLRWHERDEPEIPALSPRLTRITPRGQHSDPDVLDEQQTQLLLQRARWIHAGSKVLCYSCGERLKRAWMNDWRPGAFRLFCLLGLEMGLRPWEAALLSWDELQIEGAQPFLQLKPNGLRPLKTPLAGTKLAITPAVHHALLEYRQVCDCPYLFAVPDEKSANGWRPPNYDTIWKALREELGAPGLNARTLRRTFATNLSRRVPNLFQVAAATRHIRLQTLQHYVQLAGGDLVDPRNGGRMPGGA